MPGGVRLCVTASEPSALAQVWTRWLRRGVDDGNGSAGEVDAGDVEFANVAASVNEQIVVCRTSAGVSLSPPMFWLS
jgi:hypothetical protein